MSLRKRSCMFCGKAIDEYVPRTQKYCTDQKCKWRYYDHIRQQSRDYRENLKRKRENLNQQARDHRSDAAEAAGIENPEDFTPVAIPVNMRCIKHIPEKQRRMFCDRLKQLFGQTLAEKCSSTCLTDDSKMQMKCHASMQDTELRSILNNACAICRGSCCINGGEHAYLKADTFLRYMQQHPELQPHQVLDEYLSCLPKKAYEDSCVYHTELGCALPYHMRSESCNSFTCEGLVEIEKHKIDTKSNRFFVAAIEEKKVLRSAFIDGNQIRGHHIYSC